jgi:hypothetical protein
VGAAVCIEGEELLMSNETRKKPYETPVIKRFPLRPEEALSVGCKSNGNSGPSGTNCVNAFGNCRNPGS